MIIESWFDYPLFDPFLEWLEFQGHRIIRNRRHENSDVSFCFSYDSGRVYAERRNNNALSIINAWDFHPDRLKNRKFMSSRSIYADFDIRIVPSLKTQAEMKEYWELDSIFLKYPIFPDTINPIKPDFDFINDYVIVAGRLVPHKHTDEVRQAVKGLDTTLLITTPQTNVKEGWANNCFTQSLPPLKCYSSHSNILMDCLLKTKDLLRRKQERAAKARDQLLGCYANAKLCVSASRYEGLGVTPLEAIMCGTPVACARIRPTLDFLGGSIEWFEPGNVEELRNIIKERDRLTVSQEALKKASQFRVSEAGPEMLDLIRKHI